MNEPNDLPPGHLRVAVVARKLGVSTSTVRRMIADGELDGYRLRQPKTAGSNTPLYVTRASYLAHVQRTGIQTDD